MVTDDNNQAKLDKDGSLPAGPLPRLLGCIGANFILIVIVVALAAAFVLLRTPASNLSSLSEFDTAIAGGQPALVEFYSNT